MSVLLLVALPLLLVAPLSRAEVDNNKMGGALVMQTTAMRVSQLYGSIVLQNCMGASKLWGTIVLKNAALRLWHEFGIGSAQAQWWPWFVVPNAGGGGGFAPVCVAIP